MSDMTREEAIQRFNGIINSMSISLAQSKFYPSKAVLNELCDMAIEALQREIPKNPIVNYVADSDGSRRLTEGWKEDALLCPVCHTYFGEVFNEGYCRACGQKIVQKRVKVVV